MVSPQSIPTASPTLSAGPKAIRLRNFIFVIFPFSILARKTYSLLSGRSPIASFSSLPSDCVADLSSSPERFHAFSSKSSGSILHFPCSNSPTITSFELSVVLPSHHCESFSLITAERSLVNFDVVKSTIRP